MSERSDVLLHRQLDMLEDRGSRALVAAARRDALAGATTIAAAAAIPVPVLLLLLAWALENNDHTSAQWWRFIAVVSGVALAASMAGNALWNRTSRLLPLTLVGQMILFETLFALLYGFLWEQRLPTFWEMAAMLLVVASVLSCVHAHRPGARV